MEMVLQYLWDRNYSFINFLVTEFLSDWKVTKYTPDDKLEISIAEVPNALVFLNTSLPEIS